jgi:glycosyltransferase involved in cell wall biosynthesis
MKLLFLTPQLPYPPHQGTTIRNFNILQILAPRHELHLLSFGQPQQLEGSPLRGLCSRIEVVPPPGRSLVRRAFETLFSPLPDMARRLDSPALAGKFSAMVRAEDYDIIQIEGIEMANYWRLEVGREKPTVGTLTLQLPAPYLQPPTSDLQLPICVFDDHNAEYILQKTAYESDRRRLDRMHGALYSYIQWHKLARFERELCLRTRHVVAVSQQDAGALTSLDPRISPVVIPHGVDLEYYVPSDEVCAKPLAELSVVFTGKMDFRPNVDAAIWFADEILPALRREIPLAHVAFVGQQPNAKVRALPARPGVEVTGRVADIRPYIADAAVYAAPIRMGGGARLKVLEAMAMGKAIVCTRLGAEGIECAPGRDLVIADRADDFAHAIAALMRDPARRKELGANARKLVEEKYDWRKLVPKFEELYNASSFDRTRTNVL